MCNKRIIIVDRCISCPYEKEKQCDYILKDIPDILSIPEWCPLQEENKYYSCRFFNKANDMDCDFVCKVIEELEKEDKE